MISMTDSDNRLASLYQRLTASVPLAPEDAGGVVAWAAGTLDPAERARVAARLAESSRHARLALLLKDSGPAASAFAAGINLARRSRPHAPRHEGRFTFRRIAGWAGGSLAAAAAALVLAFGLQHRVQSNLSPPGQIASAKPAPASDRIFTSEDVIFAATEETPRRVAHPATRGSDELFRGSFSGG